MTHTIRFTIGDWSDDGHGESETLLIEANYPVERLREAHFNAAGVLGFEIGDVCGKFEEHEISESIMDNLSNLGVECSNVPDEQELVSLWIKLLMIVDPELQLALQPEFKQPKYPSMHFFGHDDKKRHLRVPGYGIYEM